MKFDLFTAKAPPLFGLDISSSSVKMLELVDAGKGGYRVERYAIEPLARDSVVDGNINNLEAVGEAVKRAYQRLGTRTKHVAMAVPTGAVISKKIIVPAALREEELEIQVESEANQYIPFALEEVNLDFQVLGPSPSNPEEQEVLIAATRKEKVEDRVAVADIGGLKPLVMDVESFAQQTALSLVVQGLPGGGKDQNVAVVDVGANVDCRPQHLHQFAIMGEVYYRVMFGVARPRVGLLSIGEEASKGNEVVRETHRRLKEMPLSFDFVGNVEGRDVYGGDVHVIVCDGFIGNVALKISEGMVEAIMAMLKEAMSSNLTAQVGYVLSRQAYDEFKRRLDYS